MMHERQVAVVSLPAVLTRRGQSDCGYMNVQPIAARYLHKVRSMGSNLYV